MDLQHQQVDPPLGRVSDQNHQRDVRLFRRLQRQKAGRGDHAEVQQRHRLRSRAEPDGLLAQRSGFRRNISSSGFGRKKAEGKGQTNRSQIEVS